MVRAPEWMGIAVADDSGACDTITPATCCAHISILETSKSKSGFKYGVANDDGLLNMGERRCNMMTENSHFMKRIAF